MEPKAPSLTLVDTHAHLDDERFADDLPAVIQRAREAGVRRIVAVGTGVESTRRAIEIAHRFGLVYAAAGIHPHDAGAAGEEDWRALCDLARDARVVAVGETGLDYYRDHAPRDAQQEAYREHLRLARELDLPVIVHNRDASADCLAILEEAQDGALRGVAHCFSGSREDASRFLALGFYISVAGPVTFPNARRLRHVAEAIPAKRLLVETDCPYLAPQAQRGRRNEPAFVRYTVETIAEIRRATAAEIAAATVRNAGDLFRFSGE